MRRAVTLIVALALLVGLSCATFGWGTLEGLPFGAGGAAMLTAGNMIGLLVEPYITEPIHYAGGGGNPHPI